ncbi:MAG: hypothetical protein QGF90_15660 [Gammaproteobacteria bacterium]|nr:hypothetical protein [Chromatiales bacterium]MDP6653517.1 hypothetical protein [Gammaproteobacteria bacterium]
MLYPIQILLTALLLSLAASVPTLAAENDIHPAAQTVLNFNTALSSRDMDTALALLAEGAVQYNLHPAHPGMSERFPSD